MRCLQQQWRTTLTVLALTLGILFLTSSNVSAQEHEGGSGIASLAKDVVLDPTTYAPAAIFYNATTLDWKTSQPFFQHGYYEHNPRFTISGMPNDVAVGYSEGNKRILFDSLATLQMSALNVLATRVIERALIERHPEHRKAIRAIGWIERAAMASYLSYALAGPHYRQWQENTRLAGQMGY